MTQKPKKGDFGKFKIEKNFPLRHAPRPPKSLRLRRSFKKLVSVNPKSTPGQNPCIPIVHISSCNHVLIFDKFLSVYLYFIFITMLLFYTCQLSHLRRESRACGFKTSISCQLTLAGQFLTPDWKVWVVAVLLDTISKNMLTQTHVRNGNHV